MSEAVFNCELPVGEEKDLAFANFTASMRSKCIESLENINELEKLYRVRAYRSIELDLSDQFIDQLDTMQLNLESVIASIIATKAF